MRFVLLVIFCLLPSLPATAQLRTQPAMTIPFASHLELAKTAELEIIQKMSGRLKAGDRSLCRYNRRVSTSGCALQMIRTYRVHSSQSLRGLLDLAVAAAVLDRSRGLDEAQVNRELAESFLAIAENVRPQKFFALRIHAKTNRDRAEKTQARIAENAALESFRTQVLPLIGSQIAKVESSRLRARAERLHARRWALR